MFDINVVMSDNTNFFQYNLKAKNTSAVAIINNVYTLECHKNTTDCNEIECVCRGHLNIDCLKIYLHKEPKNRCTVMTHTTVVKNITAEMDVT